MKKSILSVLLLIIGLTSYSQADEADNNGYKKVYTIIVTKDGEVKHVVKQGAEINVDIDGEAVSGRWFFNAYPDQIIVVDKKGKVSGPTALNKQESIRLVVPQKQSGPSIGVGIGPVSVSNFGPKYQTFNMEKYKMEMDERMESKEEKIRREYYEKKEKEELEKEAAKAAKKAAKKKGK
jgi:hypothetical protein